MENVFVFIAGVSRIDSDEFERLASILTPGDLLVVKELVAVWRSIFDDYLFSEGDHVAETEAGTSSISGDDLGLRPVEGNIDLEFATKDDYCIITQDLCLLLGVAIEELGFGVEDGVLSGGSGVEGDVSDFGDLFAKMGEGPVELVLLA